MLFSVCLAEDKTDSVTFFDHTQGIAVKLVKWPLENVVQPAFNTLLLPIKPPLRYTFEEKVIERGVDLLTFGGGKNINVFPTMKLLSGRNTSLGLSYIHRSLFYKDRDRFSLKFAAMLDRDWTLSSSYLKKDLLAQKYHSKTSFSILNSKDIEFFHPNDSITWVQSDSSYYASMEVSRALPNFWGISVGLNYDKRNYDIATVTVKPEESSEVYDSFKKVDDIGLFSSFYELPFILSVNYNTKNSEYAATEGLRWNTKYIYSYVSRFGNYSRLESVFESYTLLGNKTYKLSHKENREYQNYLKNFGFNNIAEIVDPNKFKNVFLQRKILLNYIRFVTSWKGEEQPMAFTGYNRLGQSAPLRGYPSSRFINRGYLLWSAEYRWPLIRRVDGTFFNEYAFLFQNPEKIGFEGLYNSWGFGFRVRTSSLFLTRGQVAFHGLDGFKLILTVSAAY